MRTPTEEIFGPVVVLIPSHDESETVQIASATRFGFVVAVFTAELERAMRVGRAIWAGGASSKSYGHAFVGTAFGSVGHSGYGCEPA